VYLYLYCTYLVISTYVCFVTVTSLRIVSDGNKETT